MRQTKTLARVVLSAGLCFAAGGAPLEARQPAPAAEAPAGTVHLTRALAIERMSSPGRLEVQRDSVLAQLVAGTFKRPAAGDAINSPAPGGAAPQAEANGKADHKWTEIEADKDGWFQGPALGPGGYAFVSYKSDADRVMLLEASGHGMVYVNGQPRVGDPYQYGYAVLPVKMHTGENDLLFSAGRGRLRADLVPPKAEVSFNTRDLTLPDIILGDDATLLAGVVIVNAGEKWIGGDGRQVMLTATGGDGVSGAPEPLPRIAPLSSCKVPVRLKPPAGQSSQAGSYTLALTEDGKPIDSTSIKLRVRQPTDSFRRTFISEIDGSVQYYAVQPAQQAGPGRALVLSLHGASVEAQGQAEAYGPKSWAHVVCPTNRRPFGFDWEDWGRLDALEVLGLALADPRLGIDASRVYLTGHSMGGHGTWQLGVLFPNRFAAIGPSAGWISFMSYGGRPKPEESPVVKLFSRAAAASDTLAMVKNLEPRGVYILHGDADDNVPVSEARAMREELGKFHADTHWHEERGAGHWWGGGGSEPGAACVDWPAMFDLFASRRLPGDEQVRQVRFVTVNPAVSDRLHWVSIVQQTVIGEPSSVDLRLDPTSRHISGTTQNVAAMTLTPVPTRAGGDWAFEIDGQKIEVRSDALLHGAVTLSRGAEGSWSAANVPAWQKSPQRGSGFKSAWNHGFVLVVGTRGTAEENTWAVNKARFDAEQWWYRGNGMATIMTDTAAEQEFMLAKRAATNVILYGNADTNGMWTRLLGDSPVQVSRGHVRIGGRDITGDDLACAFIRPLAWPRADDSHTVGAVGVTGPGGQQIANRLAYFTSGTAYPDVTVFDSKAVVDGRSAARAVGFFGNDWKVESGQWAGPDAPGK